jgi:hypothetical protein
MELIRLNGLSGKYESLHLAVISDPRTDTLWYNFQKSLTDQNRQYFGIYMASGNGPKPVGILTAKQMDAYAPLYNSLNPKDRELAEATIGKPLSYEGFANRLLGDLTEIIGLSTYLTPDSSAKGDISIEDRLDTTRSRIRFILFDFEATKKENHYLKQMIQLKDPQIKPHIEGPNQENYNNSPDITSRPVDKPTSYVGLGNNLLSGLIEVVESLKSSDLDLLVNNSTNSVEDTANTLQLNLKRIILELGKTREENKILIYSINEKKSQKRRPPQGPPFDALQF